MFLSVPVIITSGVCSLLIYVEFFLHHSNTTLFLFLLTLSFLPLLGKSLWLVVLPVVISPPQGTTPLPCVEEAWMCSPIPLLRLALMNSGYTRVSHPCDLQSYLEEALLSPGTSNENYRIPNPLQTGIYLLFYACSFYVFQDFFMWNVTLFHLLSFPNFTIFHPNPANLTETVNTETVLLFQNVGVSTDLNITGVNPKISEATWEKVFFHHPRYVSFSCGYSYEEGNVSVGFFSFLLFIS